MAGTDPCRRFRRYIPPQQVIVPEINDFFQALFIIDKKHLCTIITPDKQVCFAGSEPAETAVTAGQEP
jgi:hypothetical protein